MLAVDINSRNLIANDFLNELKGKIVLIKAEFNVSIIDGSVQMIIELLNLHHLSKKF